MVNVVGTSDETSFDAASTRFAVTLVAVFLVSSAYWGAHWTTERWARSAAEREGTEEDEGDGE